MEFKVIRLKKNSGHGFARRCSVDNCSNDLIALMDADDISYPLRFEKQTEVFLATHGIDIVGGQITEFIDRPSVVVGMRAVPLMDQEIKQYLKKRCPMNQVTVMFKRDAYESAGGYIDWYCEEDYYLWIRMVEKNKVFRNVPENLVHVRIGDEMSARRGGMKYFLSELRIQQYLLEKNFISIWRFFYNSLIRFGGEVVLPTKIRTLLFRWLREKDNQNWRPFVSVKRKKSLLPFSVAMCVYGGDNAEWFEQALASLVNQTVLPSEIVLVIDGPIGNGLEIVIEKYRKIFADL